MSGHTGPWWSRDRQTCCVTAHSMAPSERHTYGAGLFFFFFGRLNCIFLVLTCRVQPDVAVAPLGLWAFFLILNWRIYIQDTQTFN